MATIIFAKAAGMMAGIWGGLLMGAASMIDQRLFGPKQHFEGQRMDSLQLQESSYGGMIPIILGNKVRASGNIIFATDFVEHKKTQKQGGKGGGGTSTTTTYSYSISFAIALCCGPIKGIARAWVDGKVVDLNSFNYRLYLGTEDQMPDAYMEAKNGGAGTTPAYRGLAYIVFQDMDLTNYGNRIPQIQLEIVKANSQTLESSIRELASYAKVPESNQTYSGLDYDINGVMISSQGTFRGTIEPLQTAYLFDVVESGDKLKFEASATKTITIVPEVDLGAVRYGDDSIDKLSIVDEDVLELPAQITLTFYDITNDYQKGTVKSRRLYYAETAHEQTVDLPVVLSPEVAQLIADQQMLLIWLGRTQYTGQLSNKWSVIEPADVLQSTVNGITRVFQVAKVDYDGGLVKFEAKGFKAPKVIGFIPYVPPDPPVVERGDITFYLLDMPLLTDVDEAGFYIAATTDKGFATVNFYRSAAADNSSFNYLDNVLYEATAGTALTTLGVGQPYFFDYKNSVEIKLIHGVLASIPRPDVLNWANTALLGDEVIQFEQAELVAEDTYRLTGLLRGRRGTEWAMAGHQAGERFILLSADTIIPESMPIDSIGRSITYRYGYSDKPENEGANVTYTHSGRGYKPYAVCRVRGERNTTGDLNIKWTRRTRIGGSWRSFVDVPLSETVEQYQVDIMYGLSVVQRTITTTSPTITYTAAQQSTDFGSIQSAIRVRIYQMSDKVGRGYVKEVVL